MDKDPYDSIRNKLGISDETKTSSPEQAAGKSSAKKRPRPPPRHYYRKDVYIERRKQFLMSRKGMEPETAATHATELYDTYLQRQRDKANVSREKYKKAKQFVQSIDQDLAKTMHVNPSNSKFNWIARRAKRLQNRNANLSPSDAQAEAHEQYLVKNERDKS